MGKTVAQKIFDAHRIDTPTEGVNVLTLDRVFCHEITTPIAINDLVARGKDRVFDPEKIKAVIDHVTPAKDSKTADQGKPCATGHAVTESKISLTSAGTESATRSSRKRDLSARASRSSWGIRTPAHTAHSAHLPQESEPPTWRSEF